ncbi:hypothetical protein [Streptomyces cyaneofuscatus]|uniref:hypothetical protein n=1 Tax=Streptomyces cyaneofuscatus TaxID=66883 RepID=UPI00386FF847|nr:hypothetical protein OG973_21875 [Streptomyces cyaneofuscatus]
MDTPQNTALMRALTELPGPLPARGVIHIAIRHTDRFTVVSNDLAQHPTLSTVAVGLAVRIQSLPQGTEIGIKALAARFPEGEKLIAAALRELEAHGYLQRARTRLPNGRIVTRTVFCNQPAALLRTRVAAARPQQPPAPPQAPALPDVQQEQAPEAPAPQDHAPFVALVPPPTAPRQPSPPLPQPRELTAELDRAATALLSDLRRHASQLVLSESDVRQLAPAVAAWLERDTHPDTIRHTLTNDLPQPLRHPAKLLKHRLTVLLPPPLPGADDLAAPARPRIAVTPFQTCDGCERAFRAPTPGHCRDCRNAHGPAQAAAA